MVSGGRGPATRVGGGAGELVLMWGGFPLLGAGAGWLLAAAAGWIADLPWVPLQGWFRLVAELPDGRAGVGGLALGGLGGLVVALLGTSERLIVTVEVDRVRLTRDGQHQEFGRRTVRTVFLDGRDLVLLGGAQEELARERSDLGGERLRAAFRERGWPWSDVDPHRDAYRRWVEGLPGLPAGADALLRARQRAVDRDRGGDARELRAELARIGVVVRDERKRQYWRLTTPPGPARDDDRQ